MALKMVMKVVYEGVSRYCLLVDIMNMVSESMTYIVEGKNHLASARSFTMSVSGCVCQKQIDVSNYVTICAVFDLASGVYL